MNQALEKKTENVIAITPMEMLQMAVQQGADLEKLKQLMDLQERWEKNEARKAFVTAMNAFKENPPDIYKTKHVKFGDTEYDHAILSNAADLIGAAMSKQGLSFRWDCDQLEGGTIRVTCVITHIQGHSERVSLQAGADQSGKKNNIQALGSTVSYLQRYTLFAATGLAAKNVDDDGHGSEIEHITESQAADLSSLIDEVKANKDSFCALFKINNISELPLKAYSHAVALVEAKRKK